MSQVDIEQERSVSGDLNDFEYENIKWNPLLHMLTQIVLNSTEEN